MNDRTVDTFDLQDEPCRYRLPDGHTCYGSTCSVFGWAHDNHALVKEFPHEFQPKATEATLGDAQRYKTPHFQEMEDALWVSRFPGTESITTQGAIMVLAGAVLAASWTIAEAIRENTRCR